MKNKYQGFTLVEILVVLVIVSVLASFAYSSYSGSVEKSRRRSAQGVLQGLAQAMERHQTTTGSYTAAAVGPADTGAPSIYSDKAPIEGSQTFYNIRIHSAATVSYVLAAEPVGAQSGDGLLILKSTGARGWDIDDSANGLSANLAAPPNELPAAEMCWDC